MAARPPDAADPFTLEITRDNLEAISDEMFVALHRTAHGVVMYEMLDFCVGIADAAARMIVQGNGLPFFISTLESAVRDVLAKHGPGGGIRPGDVFMTNDPYSGGGTHLNDVCLVMPVFVDGALVAFTANKGHWSELGGKDATVSTDTTEIWQEGLQLPSVRLYDRGVLNQALLEVLAANVRLPDSTLGDMRASVAALRVGERRIVALVARYGRAAFDLAVESLLDYAERMSRLGLAAAPKGTFEAEDWVDDDGVTDRPFRIKVRLTITDAEFVADFTGTSREVTGPFNSGRAGLEFAVHLVFKALTSPHTPANHGSFRPVRIVCPPRTCLTAERPAPTMRYHQAPMIGVEAMCRALAPYCPDRIPAGNHASACGANFVGRHPDTDEMYVIIEPQIGGWGAATGKDGENALFWYACGETKNIPIEVMEGRYGLLVERYALNDDDGGAGRRRGGKGIVREYRVMHGDVLLTGDFGRHKFPPWGFDDGRDGSRSSATVIRRDGSEELYHRPALVQVREGERIRFRIANGGGYGDPRQRPQAAIVADLKNGYVTPEQARRDYGFDPDDGGPPPAGGAGS